MENQGVAAGTASGTDAGTDAGTVSGVELAGRILELLRLEPLEVDMFRGQAMPGKARRLYGGQVAAQALAAAGNTVVDARPHSLHAYFLRPGDSSAPVVFEVDRLHDGRTFRRRRVTAIQHGQPILCLESSFTSDPSHATDYDPAPSVPAPEDCEVYDPSAEIARQGEFRPWRLVEARPVPCTAPARVRPTTADMWFRLLADPAISGHLPETIITYLSDLTLSATALRPSRNHPEGRTDVTGLTSLDHSVWFHNRADLSDWLLFAKIAPAAGPVRGLTAGQIFHRDGTLIASVAQEALTHSHGPGQS
jgi:acyl-CoA thioesterase II